MQAVDTLVTRALQGQDNSDSASIGVLDKLRGAGFNVDYERPAGLATWARDTVRFSLRLTSGALLHL